MKSTSKNMNSVAARLDKMLFGVGLLLVGAAGLATIGQHMKQRSAALTFERIYLAESETGPTASAVWGRAESARTGIVGKVEIPSVKLSAIILEGSGAKVLLGGIGHLSGTAFPGEVGNVVLAAHRDTYFRPLKDVHPSDIIRITTAGGVYLYEVSSTSVVDPSQTEVLSGTSSSVLTLVTCYPFSYVGHAPKRFIVRARQVDSKPIQPLHLVRLG